MSQAQKNHTIRNWSAYNQALVNRGNLTIWIEETSKKWISNDAIRNATKRSNSSLNH
jgi:hypothetical protein